MGSRSSSRLRNRLRFSRASAVLGLFVMVTVAVSAAQLYQHTVSHAASGWLSGASGDGVANGSFASWRGTPLYLVGTWADTAECQPTACTVGELDGFSGAMDIAMGGIYRANGESWSAAASGSYDSRFQTAINAIKSHRAGKGPTFVRFAHEFNLSESQWKVTSSDVTNYITAFRRVSAMIRAAGLKVSWSPNDGTGTGIDIRTAFPGASYVDIISVDSYNQWPWTNSDADFNSKMNGTSSGAPLGLESWRLYAQSVGLPMGLGEWGNCNNSSSDGGGGDSANYIQNMFNWMSAHAGSGAGNLEYDSFFNVESGYECNFGVYPSTQGAPQAAAKYKSLAWGNGGSLTGGTSSTPTPTAVPTPAPGVSSSGNLLSGKVFVSNVADSTSETGHPISYMTDGNAATRWISQPTSPFAATADLGASYTLTKLSVNWAGDTIKNFTVQMSADNTNWTTILSGVTKNTSPEYEDYTSFTATPTGRYLRINGVDRWNSSYGNSIWEVGAYGTGVATDKTPPTVTLTSPAGGASLKGTATITGNAADASGVAKVELLVDGAVKATNNSASANFSWNTASVGDGSHSLQLRATDTLGNAAASAAVSVSVNNSSAAPAPVIQAFSATPAAVIAGGRTSLNWVTTGVTTCSINPGGPQNSTATSWQTPSLSDAGSITYTLVCANASGAQTSRTTAVTVTSATDPPPKPLLVASSTIIPSGNTVTLSWAAPGASGCTLMPGSVKGNGATGSYVTGQLTATTSYTVTCGNTVGNTSSDPLTITVSDSTVQSSAPVIVSLFADPARISNGQSSTIYWATTGVPAGGCALSSSPLNSTNPNGSWTTPYLSASQNYVLACIGANGDVVTKGVSVIVNGVEATGTAATVTPATNAANSSQAILTASNGQKITNGAVATTVSGLVTLDPSNITNSTKEKSITHVEYYEGQSLIQTDSIAPFALDSTKLSNGTHTITERTYYTDGSRSEVVRVLSIANTKTVAKKTSSATGAALVISLVVVLAVVGGVVFVIMRRRPTITSLRAKYGNTIDTSLLE